MLDFKKIGFFHDLIPYIEVKNPPPSVNNDVIEYRGKRTWIPVDARPQVKAMISLSLIVSVDGPEALDEPMHVEFFKALEDDGMLNI